MPRLAALCLVSVGTVGLPSQTTHLVGPGGLPQIRDALAIASAGDTILVQPGTYAHFRCAIGVTIRAATPGSVTIAFQSVVESPACLADPLCRSLLGPTEFALPAGQTAHVVGLDFAPTVDAVYASRHRVGVTSGRTTFDQCNIAANGQAALIVNHAAVHLQGCTVSNLGAGYSALWALYSDVSASGCTVTGGDNVFALAPHAVDLSSTRFVGSHLDLRGGNVQFGQDGSAVYADNSEVWIADSALTSQPGTCPVVAVFSTGRIARSVQTGSTACGPGLPGGNVVGVERLAPLQNGTTFSMHIRTEPNQLVAVHASNSLGTTPVPGLFEQPVSLDLTAFWLAGLFLADANGDVTASWNMPAGMFLGEPLWLETITVEPVFPWQAGPVVGGVIR